MDPSSGPNEVWQLFYPNDGWPAGGFNVAGGWEGGLSVTPTLVAEGSTTTTDDDYNADHPWTMLTRNGTTKRVELLVQSQKGDSAHDQIYEIRSKDKAGVDFGMGCIGNSCTYHYSTASGTTKFVAVPADGGSGTHYVRAARHGRIAWNYIADPYVDVATDTPFMYFQVQQPSSGTCAQTDGDDIGLATATWTGTQWSWTLDLDGSCPTLAVEQGHDASVLPLPNDVYKVYWKAYDDDQWYTSVWIDGTGWDTWYDEYGEPQWYSPIDFYWDSSVSGPDADCVENVAALVHISATSEVHEGMFFRLSDSEICEEEMDPLDEIVTPLVGFSDGAGPGHDDNAIVFAGLGN